MRLLLDTHTLVWWSQNSSELSAFARAAIADAGNLIHASVVSGYEIALKHKLGKWPEVEDFIADLPNFIEEQEMVLLPVTLAHATRAGTLPLTHRDPFDRMLAAQGLIENLTIVTADDKLDQFGVRRLW